MLRIRDTKGNVKLIPVGEFVEILTTDIPPLVAQVSYLDANGLLHVVTQRDTAEAARYAKMFGVKFAPIRTLNLDTFS